MRRFRGVVAGVLIATGTLMLPSAASAATQTFQYTGAAQDWTVPYGVTSATFDVYGAEGRGFNCVGCQFRAGGGGFATASIAVTPNSSIRIMVGGQGTANSGGFNGGGTSTNAGGGATDVRIGGTALTDRVLVAGGGGGTGDCASQTESPFGGAGSGGPNGWAGQSACGRNPGGGGTQTGGGSGLVPGSLGQGGGQPSGLFAGGGGGGYYGGGSGGSNGGGSGGGGSGYGPASGYGWSSGIREGNGVASVSYEVTQTQRLQASAVGEGDGYVSSSPAGIDCGFDGDLVHNTCFADFGENQPVTVTANPSPGTLFDKWIFGPCMNSTQPTCQVTMSALRTVSARFKNGPRKLTVNKSGNGSGAVTSDPAGLDCGPTCNADYAFGTEVTLTASPSTGSDFTGWTGACTGTSTCTVTMDQVRDVGAQFTLQKRTLSFAKNGNGKGTVNSSPAGLVCGPDCDYVEAQFDYGTVVTIPSTAATGSDFVDWGGNVTGCQQFTTGQDCVLTMDRDRYAEAEYVLQQKNLTVTRSGNGPGSVASSPAGINCGADCDNSYDYGTAVTLTATPGDHTVFTGWSGACSGTSTCDVTMDQAKDVDAAFVLETRDLTVTRSGNGTGSVTSSPSGIDCGTDCASSPDYGTEITLTADPATGSNFTGWTGACSGTSACTVTMDQARDVEAAFTLQKRILSVETSGNGAGGVSSDPAHIDCGVICSHQWDYGTSVTLTAHPAANSDFTGWSGACAGEGNCTVSMDQARFVDAGFALHKRALTVSRSGNGAGGVTSNPAGIDCGNDCSEDLDIGSTVTLTAEPAAGSSFTGWSGDCSGSGTCTVAMDDVRSVAAVFADNPPVISGIRTPRIVEVARDHLRIRVVLTEAADLEFRLDRRPAKGFRPRVFHRRAEAGASSFRLPGKIHRKLKPGRYRIIAIATDSAGQTSRAGRSTFRVHRQRIQR